MSDKNDLAGKSTSANAEPGSTDDKIENAWQGVQSILSNLVQKLSDLKTVQVSTLSADLQLITEDKKDTDQKIVTGVQPLADSKDAKVEGLVTEIDMLQGDIRHFRSKKISPALEDQLKEVHAKHVETAQKIFQENIKFVADTVHRFWQDEQ
jgi:hypothetical protein